MHCIPTALQSFVGGDLMSHPSWTISWDVLSTSISFFLSPSPKTVAARIYAALSGTRASSRNAREEPSSPPSLPSPPLPPTTTTTTTITPRSSPIRLFLASTAQSRLEREKLRRLSRTHLVPLSPSRRSFPLSPAHALCLPTHRWRERDRYQAAMGHCGSHSRTRTTKTHKDVVSPRLPPHCVAATRE